MMQDVRVGDIIVIKSMGCAYARFVKGVGTKAVQLTFVNHLDEESEIEWEWDRNMVLKCHELLYRKGDELQYFDKLND